MRPVVRGPYPVDEAGNENSVTEYQQFRKPLIERIGTYCSYCEMKLDSSLAVEHVKPKKVNGIIQSNRLLNWDNLLLACPNCNSCKGNKDIDLAEYLFPDIDNTFMAFEYTEGGCISVAQGIGSQLSTIAERTLKLTGLDKTPPETREASDRRWRTRREAWDMAQRSLKRLQTCNTLEMRKQIVETMKSNGYWSVWMTVFKEDADMRRRFIEAMEGTAEDCFDAANGYVPVQRPGGKI